MVQYSYQLYDQVEINHFPWTEYRPVGGPSNMYNSLNACRKAARSRLIKDNVVGTSKSGRIARINRGRNSYYDKIYLPFANKDVVYSISHSIIMPDGSLR